MAKSYLETELIKNIGKAIKSKGNPLKVALIKTLDDFYKIIDEDEERYRQIDASINAAHGCVLDDYHQALQLGLWVISGLIATGTLAKEYPGFQVVNWCSCYAQLIADIRKNYILEQIQVDLETRAYGNEFIYDSTEVWDKPNLSHLEERYASEFNM